MFLRFILQTDKWPYTSRMISGRVPSFSAEAEGVRGSHCGRWSFHPCALGPSITKRIWTQVTDGGHVTSSEMLFALVLDLIIFHIIIYTIYIYIYVFVVDIRLLPAKTMILIQTRSGPPLLAMCKQVQVYLLVGSFSFVCDVSFCNMRSRSWCLLPHVATSY